MIDARSIKLIARLDSENINEQHAALACIDHKLFTDIAMALDAINDAEYRTGYSFDELIGIIKKRWPKSEAGWRGMSDTKRFSVHRMLVNQSWLSDYEKHKMIELNDRLCMAPGSPVSPDDDEFMDQIMRRAKKEGVHL